MSGRTLDRAWLRPSWLAAVVLAIYLPDLGQGFIKDDFAWIRASRLAAPGDVLRLITEPASGFFRPLVGLSFGLDERLFGLDAFGYGLTNLGLLGVCAAGVWRLAAAFGLGAPARLIAAALFCLNFHGINLSLLWISGRTALLLCACATWAAVALRHGRPMAAGALALAAMLSKEEAVVLPAIFAAWIAIDTGGPWPARLRAIARGAWPSALALAIYAALRTRTAAMTFATAPSYYQARLDAGRFVENVFEYLDRSATLAAAAAVAALLIARHWPRLAPGERRVLASMAVWTAGMFAITVWLPVRSSLYAVTPSVGPAIAAALLAGSAWASISGRTRRLALVAAALLPLALWPVYHARNQRLANEARLSAVVMETLSRHAYTELLLTGVVLVDDPRARPSLYHAFGGLLPDAAALAFGRPIPVSLDNTPEPGLSRPVPEGRATRRFRLENGRLVDVH